MPTIGHNNTLISQRFQSQKRLKDPDDLHERKLAKYEFLKVAHNLKNYLAGGDTKDSKSKDDTQIRKNRDFLNKCITEMQRDLNNNEHDSTSMEKKILNYYQKQNVQQTDQFTNQIRMFVDAVKQLATHATTSDTKINWFGITNETNHIALLKHGENCENYLNKNKNSMENKSEWFKNEIKLNKNYKAYENNVTSAKILSNISTEYANINQIKKEVQKDELRIKEQEDKKFKDKFKKNFPIKYN